MTSITALQAAATDTAAKIDAATTALDDLSAKLAAGETIQQSDIDAITNTLTTAGTKLQAAVDKDDPSTPVNPLI